MRMKSVLGLPATIVAAMTAIAVYAATAQATIVYDGNVTPDVIFGSGNANGFWVVGTDNSVEVGLRAKRRGAGVYNSDGAGTYSFPTGYSSYPGFVNTGIAYWNYEFAINVDPFDETSLTLADVNIVLSIDNNPGLGQTWWNIDPFVAWNDNALGTNATLNGDGDESAAAQLNLGQYTVAQNSQNMSWTFPSFDFDAVGTYDFMLTVIDPYDDSILASTAMRVEVGGGAIPEPATLALFGLGLAGLGVLRRRAVR